MLDSRSSAARWLWNHNPFYVISALLLLYGVRASYGAINIGTINCWLMMGVLGGYTLVLAIIGTLIVRWGEVWDDARSIFLLILLMFLAVSVSADDLFVKMESIRGGALLMAAGFGFSVLILLGVLRTTRIRLQPVYVVPLVLFLALFFVSPWWCSPELHPQNSISLDWTLFLFPQIAALLTLSLIPAVQMRQRSVEGSGTPWPWPLFPWSAFAILGVAVVLRSYALTLTFSPSGPIWKSVNDRSGIILDTVWRPYFLVPFALAVLVLIVEAGLAAGNRRLIARTLAAVPGVLLLAWPWSPTEVMGDFLESLTRTVGSPVWLTVGLIALFYGWALLRRIESAEVYLLASILALSVVGPKTINSSTFTGPYPIPLLLVGAVLGLLGTVRRSTSLSLTAVGLCTCGVWVSLFDTPAMMFRGPICYHLMLAACVLFSVLWHDRLAKRLQRVGALLLPISALAALRESGMLDVSWQWRLSYVLGLVVVSYLCARLGRGRAYWSGLAGTIGVFGYAIAVEGYRHGSWVVGRPAVIAFSWSLGTLILGLLISAYKARWLPPLAWNDWVGFPSRDTPELNGLPPATESENKQ